MPVKAVVYNTNSRRYFPPSECNVSVKAVVCSSAFRLPYVTSECSVPVEAVAYNTNSRRYFPPSECNVSVDAVVCSSAFRLPYVASFSECSVSV
jgi:hypothetical protein